MSEEGGEAGGLSALLHRCAYDWEQARDQLLAYSAGALVPEGEPGA